MAKNHRSVTGGGIRQEGGQLKQDQTQEPHLQEGRAQEPWSRPAQVQTPPQMVQPQVLAHRHPMLRVRRASS